MNRLLKSSNSSNWPNVHPENLSWNLLLTVRLNGNNNIIKNNTFYKTGASSTLNSGNDTTESELLNNSNDVLIEEILEDDIDSNTDNTDSEN